MTTTNTTPLLDLWEAMEDAGIQPEHINGPLQHPTESGPDEWGYDDATGVQNAVILDNQDILFILTGHAETWLRGRGWNIISPGDVHEREYEHEPRGTGYISLPDALCAEAGREG